MTKRWQALLLVLVSAAATLSAMLAGASTASASTGDTAVAGTPPIFTSDECATNSATYAGKPVSFTACFEPYGDKIWVYDGGADTYPAYGAWDNYLKDSAGNWTIYRSGTCVNHLGAGHWGYCNYDFYEDSTYNADYGYGSGVRVYPGTDYLGIGPYAWVRNSE